MSLGSGTRRILFWALTVAALVGCQSEGSSESEDGRTAATKQALSAPGAAGGGMGGSPGTTSTTLGGGGVAGASGTTTTTLSTGGVAGASGTTTTSPGAGGDTGSGTTDSWTYTGPDDALVCESDVDTSDDGSGMMFVFANNPPLNANGNEVITAAQCRVACAQAGQPNGVCRELCRGLKKAGCRGLLSWCDHLLRHRQKQAAEACYATHIALGCPGRV